MVGEGTKKERRSFSPATFIEVRMGGGRALSSPKEAVGLAGIPPRHPSENLLETASDLDSRPDARAPRPTPRYPRRPGSKPLEPLLELESTQNRRNHRRDSGEGEGNVEENVDGDTRRSNCRTQITARCGRHWERSFVRFPSDFILRQFFT